MNTNCETDSCPARKKKKFFGRLPIQAFAGIYGGTTYYLDEVPLPWFFPAMEIAGILIQLYALYLGKRSLLAIGMLIVVAGAIMERDICLGLGDIALTLCLWFRMGKKC